MPPIDNDLAVFNLLLLYCCLFLGLPLRFARVGLCRSSLLARPIAFYRCAQKSSVWPSATAIYPSACGPSGLQSRLLDQERRSRFFQPPLSR
ncbi:hypothetical protein SapgrDRAFT_3287 [Saprospira grandis DSM 2844]|uniref:Uncharacterized protein n=1 Tax=Saprospira grandis DSM 2844 TaxID=694433 RepID=J0Y087_9BACT|nr:hypothetical protein SapgrDRAFT_3287 [Saprospira grandis DSM 2844]